MTPAELRTATDGEKQMAAFQGIKGKRSADCDKVEIEQYRGLVNIVAYDGEYDQDAAAAVTPVIAREIAAELVRLADEAEAQAEATA